MTFLKKKKTLATVTGSAAASTSSANFSHVGSSRWHQTHQGAKKSTNANSRSLTSASHACVCTST
jgi:hypothetical protein